MHLHLHLQSICIACRMLHTAFAFRSHSQIAFALPWTYPIYRVARNSNSIASSCRNNHCHVDSIMHAHARARFHCPDRIAYPHIARRIAYCNFRFAFPFPSSFHIPYSINRVARNCKWNCILLSCRIRRNNHSLQVRFAFAYACDTYRILQSYVIH